MMFNLLIHAACQYYIEYTTLNENNFTWLSHVFDQIIYKSLLFFYFRIVFVRGIFSSKSQYIMSITNQIAQEGSSEQWSHSGRNLPENQPIKLDNEFTVSFHTDASVAYAGVGAIILPGTYGMFIVIATIIVFHVYIQLQNKNLFIFIYIIFLYLLFIS